MKGTTAAVIIHEGDYNEAQVNLIEIWEKHCKSVAFSEMDLGVMFTQPRKKHKTDNVRVCGLPAKLVSHVKGDRELLRMDSDKFILLMAKVGINVEVTINEELDNE